MRTEITNFRAELVDFLEKELVGPGEGDEVIRESPRKKYISGALFPHNQPLDENYDVRDEELTYDEEPPFDLDKPARSSTADGKTVSGSEESPEAVYDELLQLASCYFPSALGLSFLCVSTADKILIKPKAAVYHKVRASPEKAQASEKQVGENTDTSSRSEKPANEDSPSASEEVTKKKKNYSQVYWQRVQLDLPEVSISLTVDPGEVKIEQREVFEGLTLDVIVRGRVDSARLVTVSLCNRLEGDDGRPPPPEKIFYQVSLDITHPDGLAVFREYGLPAPYRGDQEASSLELLYRNRKAFAVGHGCAATWNEPIGDFCTQISSQNLPKVEIPPVEPRAPKENSHNMYFLSGADGAVTSETIIQELRSFCEAYLDWIEEKRAESREIPERFSDDAETHISHLAQCKDRIQRGIDSLEQDEDILRVFMLANRVMLMQQVHSKRHSRSVASDFVPFPDNYNLDDGSTGYWRSFQLAFILMNLPALQVSETLEQTSCRNEIDLIWFPTGGGKTEAYLGLAACTILFERLLNPGKSGCNVLMRYTLRLLTSQQFQRACSMICACELIRREDPDSFGQEPISIGLWVGSSLTPNRRTQASSALNKFVEQHLSGNSQFAKNPFQVLECPWCKTELDNFKQLGYIRLGTPKTVRFVCQETQCPFSDRSNHLPITVIDEDLYEKPASLILGTVDKFAMLAWVQEAGKLLGCGDSWLFSPSLVIQDELHLISGPLGSLVGLYETVIELICRSIYRPPKIVASTATARRASSQCFSLYQRPTSIFPPSGLEVSDSFFAVERPDKPSRMYVGVFNSGAPSPIWGQIRTAAALLQGALSVPIQDEADSIRDAYWTLVWYFNTLRELGNIESEIEAQVIREIAIVGRRLGDWKNVRRIKSHYEMTSRCSAEMIPELLKKLEIPFPGDRAVDLLLATNMLSVGVDIGRLGLMQVAGQPKSTSEYIQATSRVGRSRDVPGLVVTVYHTGKPRDRSHYEQFQQYHQSFYRYVEPCSVTPFSMPSLDRGLHALIVIAARHLSGLTDASQFDSGNSFVRNLAQLLEERCEEIDPDHLDYLKSSFDKLCDDWEQSKPEDWGSFGSIREGVRTLMHPAGLEVGEDFDASLWSTPTSLRNVDVECDCYVLTTYSSEEN